MIEFHEGSAEKQYYNELIEEYSNVDAIDSGYKFGVASVMASLYNWTDEFEKYGIHSVNPDEIKKAFVDWISVDVETNVMFNHFLKKQ